MISYETVQELVNVYPEHRKLVFLFPFYFLDQLPTLDGSEMSVRFNSSLLYGVVIGAGCMGVFFFLSQSDEKTNEINVPKALVKIERKKALKPSKYTVEICLSDIESVRAAVAGGCTSIELCTNRLEGGEA